MTPFFSILVPAFKASYFKECIDSIVNQTFKEFEIIIVNDASPEDLLSIVNVYKDYRIQYIVNEKNIGAENVVLNWNKCLSYAKGEYVICMGDDDCLKPNCLSVYYSLILENPGIGLLHGWTELINEKSEIIQLTTHRCYRESAMSLLWHRFFAYNNQYIGDFCFKRESLLANGGFFYLPLAWGSDDISAIIAACENGVVNTQQVVFQYRVNTMTISSSGNVPLKVEAINRKIEWLNAFLNKPQNNAVDLLYQKGALSYLPREEKKVKSNLIIGDLRQHHSFLRIIYWIKYRKKYRVEIQTLLYSLVYYLFS